MVSKICIKKIFLIDLIFLTLILIVIFFGRSAHYSNKRMFNEIIEKKRTNFSLSDESSMQFVQDQKQEMQRLGSKDKKPKTPSIPIFNTQIIITNIPPKSREIINLIRLPTFVSLGLDERSDEQLLSQASIRGHKILQKIVVSNNCSAYQKYCIDLSESEFKNIQKINSIISNKLIDEIYINIEDIEKLKSFEAILKKLENIEILVIDNKTSCYESGTCNIHKNESTEVIFDLFDNIIDRSKNNEIWRVNFNYTESMISIIENIINKYSKQRQVRGAP